MESSKAAIMKQVKEGMPNVTEVVKQNEGPVAPAGANPPPTPASVLKEAEAKSASNKTESAVPAEAKPNSNKTESAATAGTTKDTPVEEVKPTENKNKEAAPVEKTSEPAKVTAPVEKTTEPAKVTAQKAKEIKSAVKKAQEPVAKLAQAPVEKK